MSYQFGIPRPNAGHSPNFVFYVENFKIDANVNNYDDKVVVDVDDEIWRVAQIWSEVSELV